MDRRIVKTCAAIHKAYIDLVMEKSSSRITVSALARRANIDRKTFYLHYSCPDDVLVEYVDSRFDMIVAAMKKNHYFEDPFNVEKLISLLDTFYKGEKELLISIVEIDSRDDLWRRVHDILANKVVELYAPITNMDTDEMRIYYDFLSAGVINVYLRWTRGGYRYDLHHLIEMLGNTVKSGIYPLVTDGAEKEMLQSIE